MRLLIAGKEQQVSEKEDLKKLLKKEGVFALREDGEVRDLFCPDQKTLNMPTTDTEVVEGLTFDSKEGKEIYRHSASHVLAHAVKELFPDAKFAIGPAIEEGFYYDFDRDKPFIPEDLAVIEKKMQEIMKRNTPFVRKEMSRQEALEFFSRKGEEYKAEIINELPPEVNSVSLYEENGFVDLCRGPHVPSTGYIKAVKLLNIAGAYWHGDENRKMLQRIYGTAFPDKDSLQKHLDFLEEVKRRDHRKLGKDLEFFAVNEEVGPGLILWLPNGAIIRKTIEDFWRAEHEKAGYKLLFTPHIARLELWEKSGHWDFYRENMYSPMEIDQQDYEVKPMNCPFHIAVYKNTLKSYRDLPIKYAELGTVYRYERSGVLHGLLRVRGFTQDDAHIFAREDQIEEEVRKILDFTIFILSTFGFEDYTIYLSTRPEKYVGSLENWERATNALRLALEEKKLDYMVDPGEGVFYGPKIDIKVRDSLGREWQCSTIQVDFNLPERFDVIYRGKDGRDSRPIMIHRALMGSLERFFGVLIEHYAGAFPLWLSPVQVEVLSISEKQAEYAIKIAEKLRNEGIRAEAKVENEKIGYKIRAGTMRKVPYLVIIGDREVSEGTISIRKRTGETAGPFALPEFIAQLKDEIHSRR